MIPRFAAPICVTAVLIVSLTGCIERPSYGPYEDGNMGFQFFSDYDGSSYSDDNQLSILIRHPNGERTLSITNADGDRSFSGGGGGFPCLKYTPEWKDKDWWMEIEAYTDSSQEVLVDSIRVDPADCYNYSVVIDESGALTVYEGYPPWHENSKAKLTSMGVAVVLSAGLVTTGGVVTGLILWRKRKA